MPTWLKDLISIFTIKPLIGFWLLLASWLVCWLVAAGVLNTLRNGTLVYRCRVAWALALLIHAAVGCAYLIYWWLGNRMILSFWLYFSLYAIVLGIDLAFAWLLYSSAAKFRSYRSV